MFYIHPTDLRRRRKRCARVVQSLLRSKRETASSCNVCGESQNVILASHGRYGLPIRTVMCHRCGHIYVQDRLTPEGYAEFPSKFPICSLVASDETAAVQGIVGA